MSITLELTKSHFQDLCKNFDSTKNMSYEAIQAIFEYYDDMSEDQGKDINFDISMVWEFTEYSEDELFSEFNYLVETNAINELLDVLRDNTQVIELENSTYLVGAF